MYSHDGHTFGYFASVFYIETAEGSTLIVLLRNCFGYERADAAIDRYVYPLLSAQLSSLQEQPAGQ